MSQRRIEQEVMVSTTFDLPGYRVDRYLGATFGLVVRSVGIAKGITGSLRALKAGEVPEYTQLLEDSRRHAMDRLLENAQALGANAVLGMRFDSSEIGQGLAEIVAYGTAVVVATGSCGAGATGSRGELGTGGRRRLRC